MRLPKPYSEMWSFPDHLLTEAQSVLHEITWPTDSSCMSLEGGVLISLAYRNRISPTPDGIPERVRSILLNLIPYMFAPYGHEVVYFSGFISKLPAGRSFPMHTDNRLFQVLAHRVHLALVTDPGVEFDVAGERLHLPAGKIVEFDNTLPHTVVNNSNVDRIHLVGDIMPVNVIENNPYIDVLTALLDNKRLISEY